MPLLDLTNPDTLTRFVAETVPPDRTVALFIGGSAGTTQGATVQARFAVRIKDGWNVGATFSVTKPVLAGQPVTVAVSSGVTLVF